MRYSDFLSEIEEQSWLGKPKFQIEGVIFKYDPENDTIDKLKAVPEKDILISISGSWHGKIYYATPNSKVNLSRYCKIGLLTQRIVTSSLIWNHYTSYRKSVLRWISNCHSNHIKYGQKSLPQSTQRNGLKRQN